MRVTLVVNSGWDAGRTVDVLPGAELRVGRRAPSDTVVSADVALSIIHFALEFDGRICRVRDVAGRGGTLVNGQRIETAVLNDGDEIRAGATRFNVRFDSASTLAIDPPRPPTADRRDVLPSATNDRAAPSGPSDLYSHVLNRLRSEAGTLYAILDAARDPLIPVRLSECGEEYQSLYEGLKGERLAAAAPYLVALPKGSAFLETLIRDGWAKSWGVFLTCDRQFAEVRKHLRHLLTVELEVGKRVRFRFYDPRVLRIYLPTCTFTERSQFFGPIESFMCEAEGVDQLDRFDSETGVIEREFSR